MCRVSSAYDSYCDAELDAYYDDSEARRCAECGAEFLADPEGDIDECNPCRSIP